MTDEEREFDAIADAVIEENKDLLTRVGSEQKFW